MDGPVELTRGERVDRVLSGKEPHLRPGDPPPVPQEFEQLRREHRKAVPASLALLDPEQHAPGIDVADLERYDLGDAQARAIGALRAALYFGPGAASRKRATASGLKTTGILRGSATNVSGLVTAGRSTVTEKKNRRAETALLILGGRTPASVRCNW